VKFRLRGRGPQAEPERRGTEVAKSIKNVAGNKYKIKLIALEIVLFLKLI